MCQMNADEVGGDVTQPTEIKSLSERPNFTISDRFYAHEWAL